MIHHPTGNAYQMELDNPVLADIANPFQDQQLVLKDQLVV